MKLGKSPACPDTYVKNVALSTAFSGSNLTLRKLKALHVLALTVREQFFMRNPQYNLNNINLITKSEIQESSSMYCVEESQVMRFMGYDDKKKYYSLNQVLNIFDELSSETIYFDALGIVKSKTDTDSYTGFTRPLGSAERESGLFKFYVPPSMVSYIIQPEVSFNAPISWGAYTNKYSPAIYETCLYYYQNGQEYTDWFSLEAIRQITSTQNLSTYDKFNNLKERVLDITIDNINKSDEFLLHLSLETTFDASVRKPGRKTITHIRFKVREKVNHLSHKPDVINSIALSAMRTEIESLGVAKHAIDDVLAECHDMNGDVSLPFVKWTVRKGHEIKTLTKFRKNQSTENNFGGYYRKNILRARKEEWFAIHHLLTTTLEQQGHNLIAMQPHEIEQYIEELESRLKRTIALQYIESLYENGLAHLRENFQLFLEKQLPQAFERYIETNSSFSIFEMAEQGNTYLLFYLDYVSKIFSKEAYQSVLRAGAAAD